MSKMRRNFTISLLFSLLLTSCYNEVDLTIPGPTIPLVYCMVDPCDSFCYVSVSESFIHEGDITDVFKKKEFTPIKDAEITLEAWGSGYKLWETGFSYYGNNVPTDSSIVNIRSCYKSDNTLLFDDPAIRRWRDSWNYEFFRLTVNLPDSDNLLYSRIPIIKVPSIKLGYSNMKLNLYGQEDSYFQISVDYKTADYGDLWCEFHFCEYSDEWINQEVRFLVKSNFMLPQSIQDPPTILRLYEEAFFNKIVKNIDDDPNVKSRLFSHMIFTVYISDEYFHDYEGTYLNADQHDFKMYTNITNGYGLFSVVRSCEFPLIKFDRQTHDSLCFGRITKHLNFRSW